MEILKKVVNIIIQIILLVILFINVVILVDAYINPEEIPSFFGWKPFIVLSDSMENAIYSGDVTVVKEGEYSNLNKDEIIAYREKYDDDDEAVILTRIQEKIEENGQIKYKTVSDNSKYEVTINKNQIEGTFKYRIAGLGNLLMFLQTPIGMVIVLLIPISVYLLVQFIELIRYKRELYKKYKETYEDNTNEDDKNKNNDTENKDKGKEKGNEDKAKRKPRDLSIR